MTTIPMATNSLRSCEHNPEDPTFIKINYIQGIRMIPMKITPLTGIELNSPKILYAYNYVVSNNYLNQDRSKGMAQL
jgi:hypothetical protein